MMDYVEGETLKEAWPRLSSTERMIIVSELRD